MRSTRAARVLTIFLFPALVVPALGSGASPCGTEGCSVWSAALDGGANGSDVPVAVAVTPNAAAILVAGSAWGGGSRLDLWAARLDAETGATAWARRMDGGGGQNDFVYDMALAPDGERVAITGTVLRSTFGVRTVVLDADTGDILWSASLDTGASDYGRKVAFSPDGATLYVAADTNPQVTVLAYDVASGALLWQSGYSRGTNSYVRGLGVDAGAVYVIGRTLQSWSEGTVFSMDAATGALRWSTRFASGGNLEFHDGRLVGSAVLAVGRTPGNGDDALVVALEPPTGAVRWSWTYNAVGYRDEAWGIGASRDGGRALVALELVTGWSDAGVASLDVETGALAWLATYNGPDSNSDKAVDVVEAAGVVVATGEATRGGKKDLLVLGLDAATGTRRWASLRDAAGLDDAGAALAADPSERRVFAVGHGYRASGNADVLAQSHFLRDPPGAPVLTAQSGNRLGEVRLTWVAPFDGNSPILGYRVYRDGVHLADSPAGDRQYVDTRLLPLEAHDYAVSAWTAVGETRSATQCAVAMPYERNPVLTCERLRDLPRP